MAVELEGRRVEQVIDRPGHFEEQEERTGRRLRHMPRAEGKMWEESWQAGREEQKTARRGES